MQRYLTRTGHCKTHSIFMDEAFFSVDKKMGLHELIANVCDRHTNYWLKEKANKMLNEIVFCFRAPHFQFILKITITRMASTLIVRFLLGFLRSKKKLKPNGSGNIKKTKQLNFGRFARFSCISTCKSRLRPFAYINTINRLPTRPDI